MLASHLPTQTHPPGPTERSPVTVPIPVGLWEALPAEARTQVASIVGSMMKRMIAGAPEERRDVCRLDHT
jgi:hypothetical protein